MSLPVGDSLRNGFVIRWFLERIGTCIGMRPRERRETGKQDLFRSRLDQIIDMNHALAKLARSVDWGFLEERFGAVYSEGPGQPPLPTRLMAGLAILKHTHNLSDEALCERWVENPYYQYFCGEEFFQHRLAFDRSSLTRWRQRMGEEKLKALLEESLSVAHKTGALSTKDLERVAVDTTVQPKAIAHPTDARLMHKAIEKLVALAKREGVILRQSYLRVAKRARDHGRALQPRASVQTRQPRAEVPSHTARPRHSRRRPEDRGQ
jgi:IS5 family transposase